MLTVYRSNRAELLAQVLAAQLRQVPPDPFETVQVVVNTWPTSRWLGEQLAIHLGGIVANVRFPFPGSRLRQLVDQVLADPPSAGDPWRAEQLVCPAEADEGGEYGPARLRESGEGQFGQIERLACRGRSLALARRKQDEHA